MGLLLFALYAASHYGTSAPILSSRQDQISSWHSEPNGRGTWGLLNSCVITMAICVWSAVHLNVPGNPPKQTWKPLSPSKWWDLSLEEKLERWQTWNYHLRRTRWTLMGLLAPELVVYCAWIQWSNARELSRCVARHNYPRKYPWTLAHSFFAGMGGFAVDSSDFISGQDYMYLTTAGVERVVELGHLLPHLRKEAVLDKSKADSLGKILVCLQAGYMIFQVIGRLVTRLPVTVLEVNTLGHVLCALTMYAFWWDKPLGVSDAIVLSDDWVEPFVCLWAMENGKKRPMQDQSSQDQASHIRQFVRSYREMDLLALFAQPDCPKVVEEQFYWRTLPNSSEAHTEPELSPRTQRNEEGAGRVHATENTDVKLGLSTSKRAYPIIQRDLPEDLGNLVHHSILFYWHSDPSRISSEDDILQRLGSSKLWDGLTHVYYCDEQDEIEAWWECWSRQFAPEVNVRDFERWSNRFKLRPEKPVSPFKTNTSGASAFLPQHIFLDSAGLHRWELAYREWVEQYSGFGGMSSAYLRRRVGNWPIDKTGLLSNDDYIPVRTLAVVTALYGALHALCWHSHFPSVAEKMLWRISSIVIAAGPVAVWTGGNGWDKVKSWLGSGTLRDTRDWMGVIVPCLGALVYVSSRVFILLEAFISLRSLPEEAYQTPNWTSWLPHL